MILPNKAVPYDKSVLSKLPSFLRIIKNPISVKEAYKQSLNIFKSIEEFIYAIEMLFILDKIDYSNGDIVHVERNDL